MVTRLQGYKVVLEIMILLMIMAMKSIFITMYVFFGLKTAPQLVAQPCNPATL